MHQNRYISIFLLVFILSLISSFSHAQLGLSFDIPKPKQYEERQLRSEKSESKKFTIPRRFIQNTTTHYNYFFNANNKMNEIIDRAKAVHRDDFTQLLSFYNYDLEETAKDSVQLTFQFINYAFAPKEKDGYYRYIGSRMDDNSAISVATKEKNNLAKKVF